MSKIVIGIISALVGAVGLVVGWLIGANIAGNYFVNFVFFGVRGYEAGGALGGSVLVVVFSLVTWWLLRKLSNAHPPDDNLHRTV